MLSFYVISLASKISFSSTNHNPDFQYVICTGITLFALVLLFFALLSANQNHVIFHVNYLRANCVYKTKRVYEEARYLFILSLDKTEGVLENSPKLTEVCMSLCKHSRCILFRI